MTDKEQIRKVAGIYEELKGILSSIPPHGSWFDDNGFIERTNKTIIRAKDTCPEINQEEYFVKGDNIQGRIGQIIHTVPTRASLSALVGRLKGAYNLDVQTDNSGHTFIQNQTQVQSQFISSVLDLQERILKEIPKYKENSKERGFLEKIKSSLPSFKSALDIMSGALKIGADCGLDASTIHKLLGL